MMQPTIITTAYVAAHLPSRPADSHKGTYGTLLALCGSYGMAGAALLCARGALRSGVGLLTVVLTAVFLGACFFGRVLWKKPYHSEKTEISVL